MRLYPYRSWGYIIPGDATLTIRSMKTFSRLLTLGVLITCQACATLDKSEIRTLHRVAFGALRLAPLAEPTELRVDLVRQQTSRQVSENTVTYQDVPYHPLGFDLGNGLFYDLNGNLSIRVNFLLGVEGEPVFKIKKEDMSRGKRGIEYYTFRQDSLLKSYEHKDRIVPLLVRDGGPDSLSFGGKFVRDYAIVQRDSSVVYRGKHRARDILRQQPDGSYALDKWLSSREFQKNEKVVELGRHFRVELTNHDRTMQVWGSALFGKKLLFTIERGTDKILVYDQKGAGKMIKLGREEFALYRNRTLLDRYALQTIR